MEQKRPGRNRSDLPAACHLLPVHPWSVRKLLTTKNAQRRVRFRLRIDPTFDTRGRPKRDPRPGDAHHVQRQYKLLLRLRAKMPQEETL